MDIHHDKVREHVLKWGHKIREDYHHDLTRKKVKTMQMDEQYISIRFQDPRDSSVQIIVKLDSRKNKIIDLEVNNTKQITDLHTKLTIEKLDQPPETVLSDAAKGIESELKEYNETEHMSCLGHRVRNVRKRKYCKHAISELSSKIIEAEKKYEEEQRKKYRGEVMKMLTKLVKEKKITKWNGWREIKLMNNLREEELGSKFGEDAKELRDKLHQAILHRRLYCSFEASERMKHKWSKNISIKEALKLELTTGKLEGFNRLLRNRERKALCYRSKETVEALAYLFSEFYNYRRGHGSVETPFDNASFLTKLAQKSE